MTDRWQLDDRRLVQETLEGDTAAFEELVSRYQKPLFNTAFRITGSRDDALDATQTALVKAYDKLASYRPQHRFFSWVYRIVVNEALDSAKRANRWSPDEPDERSLSAARSGAASDPEKRAASTQLADALHRAVAELKPDYRAVVVLRHFNDLTYREIADIVGASEKTVKSRLFTARRELRGRLLPFDSA